MTPSPLESLQHATIAVIGFGNQGAAHALNLRDSGLRVIVGARPDGRSAMRAETAGFDVRSPNAVIADADLAILSLPDEHLGAIWTEQLAAHCRPGTTIGVLHGFAVHYQTLRTPKENGVVMVAPKGPGATLRARFVQGHGIPALVAVHHDVNHAAARAHAWAHGIGAGRAAIIPTTIGDETETDLFGEQAVLCGGLAALVRAAYETLVDAGYPADLAYMECVQEVKQVADLLYEHGLAGMMDAISNTAEFGAAIASSRLDDAHLRTTFRELLDAVRDGSFARELLDDAAAGSPALSRARAKWQNHPLETSGHAVRAWLPWLRDPSVDADTPTPPISDVEDADDGRTSSSPGTPESR